ncbi:MAG: hypothetical protein K2N67_00305 [Mucispirillum sp.]|nr:hypothetical protein [Mucispirillum sp.]
MGKYLSLFCLLFFFYGFSAECSSVSKKTAADDLICMTISSDPMIKDLFIAESGVCDLEKMASIPDKKNNSIPNAYFNSFKVFMNAWNFYKSGNRKSEDKIALYKKVAAASDIWKKNNAFSETDTAVKALALSDIGFMMSSDINSERNFMAAKAKSGYMANLKNDYESYLFIASFALLAAPKDKKLTVYKKGYKKEIKSVLKKLQKETETDKYEIYHNFIKML